jgi:hypothetical protein
VSKTENLRQRLEKRSDDELLEILWRRDTDQWQPVVFPLAEEILRGRGIDVAQALARLSESESGAPADDPLVPIAGFATVVESEACRSALVAAGFRVAGADQFLLQVDPALGPALGGFLLAVPQSEAEEARSFLAAAEGGELAAGLGACPTCGAEAVVSDRAVTRSGTLINTLFLGPRVEDATISFRCSSCGATWK